MEIDIPTAITAIEAGLLERLAAGVVVAEAGCLLGYSTVVMARVARKVFAVDPHDGYPENAPRPTLETFLRNIERYGVRERVIAIVGTVAKCFPALSASVCFLDLTGEYGLTLDAIRASLLIAPLVAVHDYGRGGCQGCTDAVDFVVRQLRLNVTRSGTLVALEC